MNRNTHEQARKLIALGGGEELAGDQQNGLRTHLKECAACSEFADAVSRTVSALHSEGQAADFALLQATQRRVRLRALELRQERERTWLACLACVFVGLSAAVTTPMFWRVCEWIGQRGGMAHWVWQAGFGFFWIVPALVVSVVLLAHGTHVTADERQGL